MTGGDFNAGRKSRERRYRLRRRRLLRYILSVKGVSIEEPKAFRDHRGWSVEPFSAAALSGGAFANLHIVSLAPGKTRGNHVHRVQVEKIVPVGGCRFVAENPETGERLDRVFAPNELAVITIEPGIAHAFRNESASETYLVVVADRPYNSTSPDVEPRLILD